MNQQLPSPMFRKFMIVFASIICVFYLAYRAIYTFNLATPYAVFASVFLYVGEFFGIMNLLLYFLQVWEVSEPPAEPVLEGRSVDVLVPTYNEDPALLRATLEACIRMDYPHKTFVLDDGRRPEVEALAKELGVIYITRPDNRHAKAGNLNNALEQTDSEFVVVLDADHVPEPHFVTRLIGYFRDEGVAFVQTPHAFYNFDSFQARLDHKNRRYWEEGDLFYRVIQPGRNKWNAPIFAGSAAMFRRTALKEIGYIATETITEDMHTGLRLHARGWKSIAISERLVAGQAPPDIKTFHAQRLRWGEGNLSIMRYDNALTVRGLTMPQRLCYFGSSIHWASGLFKLAIYLTPILMLFSGVPPVREFSWDLIVVTLTYLFFSLYAMKVVSNGYGSIVNSELFSMVNFWTQIKATFRAIFRRQGRFVVTPKGTGKGVQKSVWPYVRPQTYLIILSVLAIFWGWLRLSLDLNPIRAFNRLLSEFNFSWTNSIHDAIARAIDGTILNHPIVVGFGISDDYLKPVVPTIWCLIFFWIAYKVTQRAFWPADRRFAVRHQVHLPVEYEVAAGQGTAVHYGVTVDLNDSGMAFVSYEELPINAVLRFTVRGAGEVVKCKGEIRSTAAVARGGNANGHRYGVQFLNLTPPQVDAINRMCLHYAVPRMFDEYDRGNRNTFWNRFKLWQSRGMVQRRNARRNAFSMPIIVNTGTTEETTHFSTTEDISRVAAAAMFDSEIPAGSRVGYLLPTPLGEVRGTATVLRAQPVPIAGRTFYRTVLEFQDFEGQGRTTIQSLANPTEHAPLGAVLKPDRRTFLPKMKIPILVGLLIALPLILMQMGVIFPFYYKDDEQLKKMIDSRQPASDEEIRDYKRIFAETMKDPRTAPTDRLVLLMNLGNQLLANDPDDKHGIRQDLEQVTLYLAVRDPSNMGLSTALVHAYRNTGKYAEAEQEYKRLVALSERGRLTPERLKEVRFAGARVAVDAKNYPLAMERFKKLFDMYPKDQELRNEYAGICIQGGKVDEAINLISSGDTIDVDGRKLLIAAYMQKKEYSKAANEAKTLAKETEDAEKTLALQAEIEREARHYLDQIRYLEKLRDKQKGQDPTTLVKLAQAMVNQASSEPAAADMGKSWSHYDEKALDILYPLLQEKPIPEGAVDVFVEAASKMNGIETGPGFNPEKQARIKKIALELFKPAYDSTSNAPSHAIYLTRLGWVLQRVGETDKSSMLVRRALEINPGSEDVRRQLAALLLQQHRAREAGEVLGGANSPEARKLLIGIYVERKEFDKALEIARNIAENDRNWDSERQVADILSWKGDYAEAIKIYEKHIQDNGPDTKAEARIAEITLWAKYYNDAVAKYQALLDTDKRFDENADKYGDGFINAASSAKELTPAQIKLAEKLLARKLKGPTPKDQNGVLALSRLAWVMLKANQREKANEVLNKLVQDKVLDKGSLTPAAREEIAGVYTDAGKFKEAIALLDNPKTDEERLGMAKMYTGAREWTAAEKLLKEIIDGKPNDKMLKNARVMLADVLSYKGEHDQAIAMFKKLSMDYSDDTELQVREAEVTLWSKRYDQALEMFQTLYDKHPTDTKVWSGYASSVAALGGNNVLQKVTPLVPAAYVPTLKRIAEKITNDPAVDALTLSRIALAMHYVDEPQKAQLFANRALALKPRDAVVRRDLANTLSALKRYREAIDLFTSVEMTDDDRRRLIDIATAGEQMDVAVREARWLVNKDPTNRKDQRLLAEVLSWRGDFAESLKLYEKLIKENPKDKDDLRKELADVTLWWKHYPEALIRYGELIDQKLEQPRVLLGFIDAAASAPSISPAHARQAMLIYDLLKDDLKDPERLSRLAWVMLKLDHAAKADPLLERAVALDPKDPESRKELAGVLTSRLFPKDPVTPEAGIKPVTRKWLINSAIALYRTLDPDTDFDPATRLNFITLLIASERPENLELAERLLTPLYNTAPKEDVKLRIRYGEVLLWAGKYDPTKAKYRRAQEVFKKVIAEIKDNNSPWKELARIRLGQSYLWAHNYDAALPIFEDLLSKNLIEPEKSRERDIWMGYIDSLAGRIGEEFRLAKGDDDLDRIRANLYTAGQRKLILAAYAKLGEMKPDIRLAEGDPDYYAELLDYYAGTTSRLGMELLYMDERAKAREAYNRALTSTPDRANALKLWNEYARSLMNVKAYQEAGAIIDALMKQEPPLASRQNGN